MKFSERGKKLTAAVILLFSLGLAFADILLVATSFVAFMILVYDRQRMSAMMKRREGVPHFDPDRFETALQRGESATFETNIINSCWKATFTDSQPWLKVEPSRFERGTWPVKFVLSPRLTGIYQVNDLGLSLESRYGFFVSDVSPKLSLRVRVYPRFTLAALAAAEMLLESEMGWGGQRETKVVGPGIEYSETLPYRAGDDLRRVDWKATARLSSLMVKHFYREGGGAIHLIYFLESPGPATHDMLATQFLNTVTLSVISGTSIVVNAFDKGKSLLHLSGNGRDVLASALSLVLNQSRMSLDELYSIIDVVPLSEERRALLLAGRNRLVEILLKFGRAHEEKMSKFWSEISETSAEEAPASFMVLSSLVRWDPLLTRVIEETTAGGNLVTIHSPRRPWVDASSLEEAYRMSMGHGKLLNFVAARGCQVVSLPVREEPKISSAQVISPAVK
jgi:hypothetical protein